MTPEEEQVYELGSRAAWTELLGLCLRHLGREAPAEARASLVLEQTVAALRRVCAKFGDNEWDDGLHPADVIEKHLERHLVEREERKATR